MWTNGWPGLELICAEGVEAIDANALRVLEDVGHRVTYEGIGDSSGVFGDVR